MGKTILALALLGLVLGVTGQPGAARAAIRIETVNYPQAGATLEGWLVYDDTQHGKRPGIVVFPAFWGPERHDKDVAVRLAKMGYVAFVADMYGKGVHPKTPVAARAEAGKYEGDRPLMVARTQAALAQLQGNRLVDPARLAAIGYCFGGASALELARSGAPLVDVVSFHGELNTPDPTRNNNIKAHVLVLHGADDPIVGPEKVATFEREMRATHVDWQVVLYANTMHSFTDNTHPDDPQRGAMYNATSDRRSWQAMTDLFNNTLR